MAVNGGHAGTKKGPNWGHVKNFTQISLCWGAALTFYSADCCRVVLNSKRSHMGGGVLSSCRGGKTDHGTLKRQICLFLRQCSLKSPMPQRREAGCKSTASLKEKPLFWNLLWIVEDQFSDSWSKFLCHFFGTGKGGHYETGRFTGRISRISRISKFSRI